MHFNYSFLRNVTKNIGNNLSSIISNPSDSNSKSCLKALVHLYGLLPKKESQMFEDLVINKLVSELKNNNDFKTESEEVFCFFTTHK